MRGDHGKLSRGEYWGGNYVSSISEGEVNISKGEVSISKGEVNKKLILEVAFLYVFMARCIFYFLLK